MKNRFIKYPYEKEYLSQAELTKEVNGITYAVPAESIVFQGNENTIGDIFKINEEKPETLNILGKTYFKTDKDALNMKIDYSRRLYIMQQNLGSAILRLCIKRSTNLNIIDYKIDETSNKLFIDAKDISFTTVDKLEELCNYVINANLLVRVFEEENKIEIKGMGTANFSGPCLRRTGEVSILKIGNIEKNDTGIILNIKCGERGYYDYKEKSQLIDNIKSILFLDDDNQILKEIKLLKSRGENLKEENKKMEKELGLESVKEYKKYATTVEGINYIYKVVRSVNFKDLKFISSKIMDDLNYVQIYGIPNGPMSQILVARSKNLNINLKEIYDKIAPRFNLVGTGNMYTVQANVKSENLAGAMETFLLEVKYRNSNNIK